MTLAELAVKKALRLGATEAEAFTSKTLTTRVEFEDKIRGYKTVESTGINVRVVLDRRVASHSTSVLETSEVEKAVERAIKIAEVAPEDADWHHLNKYFGKASAEEYYDKTVEELRQEEIVEAIQTVVAHVRDVDKRVGPSMSSLTTGVSHTEIANSHGLDSDRKGTNVSFSLRTKAEEAGQQSSGFEQHQGRSWKNVDFEGLATNAAEQALKYLKTRPAEGGKIPVIIKNEVFAEMLGVMLSGPTNAEWVQKGRSPLADKTGSKIASDNFTVIDDGLLRGGLLTRPFDDEGHPTQTTTIIDKGVLKGFLYDSYTGLKQGVESTGNAVRPSYWTAPQPAPSNFVLQPGSHAPEEIIRDTKDGLYAEVTIGEWLSDPISGSLSATVTHGQLVKNGEPADTIKGAVISGDFWEILKSGVEAVGSDLRNSGPFYSPTVKLNGLTIAGK